MARPVVELEEAEQKPTSRLVRRVIVGLVVFVSLVLFALWRSDSPRVEQLRMAVVDAFTPSMSVATTPIALAADMIRDWQTFIDVYNQNRVLRREIERLRGWRAAARSLEEENAQLRALNNVQLKPKTTFVTGDVIADSGGPFRRSVLVNVGRREGVNEGAAAVDGVGLVGRVVGVGNRAARLLLLTDYASRVPVVIRPSGKRAMLVGDGTALPLLEFVDSPDEITPGDAIETSGEGGVLPPDLPVGQVVRTRSSGLRARLAADYGRLEFVRVLHYRPETQIDVSGSLIVPEEDEGLIGPPAPPGLDAADDVEDDAAAAAGEG